MILGNLEPQRCCWKWCSWATFRLINSGGLGRLQALTIKSTNGLKTPNCKRYLFLTKGRILGFPEKHHHKHTRIYILRFKTEVKPVPGIYIMWYVLIILMIVLFWLFFYLYGLCIQRIPLRPPCDNAEARLCFDNAEKSGLAQAGDGPTASSLGIRLDMVMIR